MIFLIFLLFKKLYKHLLRNYYELIYLIHIPRYSPQQKCNHFFTLLWGNGEEQQGTKLFLKAIKKTLERVINLVMSSVITVLEAEGVGFEPTVPLQIR